METIYLHEFIVLVERELEKHNNEAEAEVGKRQTVRGDEFEATELLDKLASRLDQKGKEKQAQETREHARELLASQLNELDGFAN